LNFKKIDFAAVAVLLGALVIVSFGYTIYYFLDDYPYLHITEYFIAYPDEIPTILYSFDVWSYYRPLVKFIWIVGYLTWGVNSWGYTSVTALFFIIAIFMLYKTGVMVKNRLCGLIAAFFYMTYYPVLQGTWHKSGISAYSEMCFIILFIYFSLKWIKKGAGNIDRDAVYALIFMFLSIISKETSLLLAGALVPFIRKKGVIKFILISIIIAFLTFFIPRLLFISYGPLHQPGFHPDKIFSLFDNFVRLQYMTLIGPYTLIAAFFSYRRRSSLPLLGSFLFILVLERFVVSPENLPTRLDLMMVLTAMFSAFFFSNSYKRFCIWFSVILLAPAFAMGDANIHQTFESCIGLALLLGLGFSDHSILLKRGFKKIRNKGFLSVVRFDSFNFLKVLRGIGVFVLIPLIIYSSCHIMKANITESVSRYRYFRDSSRLTVMVRDYLYDVLPQNARIHNNTMPAHISYPDLEYDLNLNGRMDIKSDDDISNGYGYIIISGISGETGIIKELEAKSDTKKIREFVSGKYFSKIFFREKNNSI